MIVHDNLPQNKIVTELTVLERQGGYMCPARLIVLAALFTGLLFACGGDDQPMGSSATDRDKFLGKWAGTYQCTNLPGDTLNIDLGTGDTGFDIILHRSTNDPNPEVVSGELTSANVITIAEQTIGGFPGSGKITFANDRLSLEQSGFGITCTGSGYVKF